MITNHNYNPSSYYYSTEHYLFFVFIGFDPELLGFVPRPVAAMIFLYPITDAAEQFRHEEEAALVKKEQDISPDVMFFKQTISNACGMMALIHSLANKKELVGKCLFLFFSFGFLNNHYEGCG